MEDLHKIFGRHTNLGKMMHSVYNAPNEKNSYQPDATREQMTVRPSNPTVDHESIKQAKRDAIRAQKNKYKLPKRKVYNYTVPKILLQKKRKPQHQIIKEYQPLTDLPAYVPAQPREEIIDDLQCVMESGKGRKEITFEQSQQITVEPITKKERIQQRMDELLNEITERQQFLATMKELQSADYPTHVHQMNAQIKAHFKEFKTLDKIRSEM